MHELRCIVLRLDHCVIAVSEWERSNRFYEEVLGATLVERAQGWAYRFGDQQLNVHGPGIEASELATIPVQPGGSDLCFAWDGTPGTAIEHLTRHGVSLLAGPVHRSGARGTGESVYFRDPDGSLLEFICYPT